MHINIFTSLCICQKSNHVFMQHLNSFYHVYLKKINKSSINQSATLHIICLECSQSFKQISIKPSPQAEGGGTGHMLLFQSLYTTRKQPPSFVCRAVLQLLKVKKHAGHAFPHVRKTVNRKLFLCMTALGWFHPRNVLICWQNLQPNLFSNATGRVCCPNKLASWGAAHSSHVLYYSCATS